MYLYRVTVRDKDGSISDYEKLSECMESVLEDCPSEILKAERIEPWTNVVLGGIYYESPPGSEATRPASAASKS